MADDCNSDFSKDIKALTIHIKDCFSGADSENLKWLLLKEYQSKYLVNIACNPTVVTSYVTVISTLLDSLRPSLFAHKWQEILFDELFLLGVHHEAFLLLVNKLSEKETYKQRKILNLLQNFFKGSAIESLLMYQCSSHEGWDLKYVSKTNFWDNLITAIISLPERIANKTRGKSIKLFSPSCYTALLLSAAFKVLSLIHDRLTKSQDSSLEFLAKMCGRLCNTGNADLVSKKFAKELVTVCEADFIWRRIFQNFIAKMPSNSLDSFIPHLLLAIPWYGYVEWILGEEGIKDEKINYIMTVKLLFVRVYKQDLILQNTIGYFASSKNRVSHFLKILNSLLDSWMDSRALKCQNLEQKVYAASALMVCAGWVGRLQCVSDTKACINKILQGTQLRLGSSEEVVRSLGMIIGEGLIKSFEPDSPPLEFDYTHSDMINQLKDLLLIPEKPGDNSLFQEDLRCFDEAEDERSRLESNPSTYKTSKISTSTIDELDSDDDLEPFGTSQDAVKADPKCPLYLRDCLKGLMEQEDAETFEHCLNRAEELIKKNPYAAQEVAEEMSKIMLHLDDKFSTPNFLATRHKILITLTVESPAVVSKYLISQFPARDYNIRQRLDILEVLAASSMLLSNSSAFVSETQPPAAVEQFVAEGEANWKMIVKKRVDAKTKRYTKSQKLILKENKFSAIAGHFFYPLLNTFSTSEKFFDITKENYVLGRFVYTLGIIMHAAANTTHCRQMGTTLLQFLPLLRSHTDVFIRESVLFAVAATYISIPSSVLLSEMLPEVLETNEWLESVAVNDPESSCVEKAIRALSLFQSLAADNYSIHSPEGLLIPIT